jgi:hypothetical protein
MLFIAGRINVDAPFEVGGLRLTNPPVFRGAIAPSSEQLQFRAGDDNESVGPLAASDIHHFICGRFSLLAPHCWDKGRQRTHDPLNPQKIAAQCGTNV